MTRKLSTKPSIPVLSDVARHVVAPSGAVSTGWPAVEQKAREFGVSFRWWQVAVGRIVLAKRADGKYASTIGGTGLSIPRQVGKTFLVATIVFALCLLRPGLTVIWTAHRLRTAEETFGKMQAFSRRRGIAPHVLKVVLGSGDQAIEFRNGSRILFGARERGFGRGFDEVDVLIFDEAQILTDAALDDMIPATNQSRQDTSALLLFMGTPPKPTDPSEVFTRMRTEALSGEDEDTGWIEFGADPGYVPTAAPADLTPEDWRQIQRANPSFPDDTPREAILRMRKKLGPESFVREGMGIWDELEKTLSVIPLALWADCVDAGPDNGTPPSAIAVDASHDGVLVAAGCWRLGGSSHLEVLAVDDWTDDEAAADWVAERAGRRIMVFIDSASPAARLIPLLKARKVKVASGTAGDMSRACGGFFNGAVGGLVTHDGHPFVSDALEGATKRKIGDAGGWGWDRRDPETNIAPLVAVTLAHYAASLAKPARSGRSSEGRRAVTL